MYGFVVTVKLAVTLVTLAAHKQLTKSTHCYGIYFENIKNLVEMWIILAEAITNRNDLKEQVCRQIFRKG